ncbi:Cna B-type domain-containing protein [Companilactobacillus zhachilii]|uniref:Cna B-type domain-containing protein n=1 Tax=Companilactobacillus zhachilii TaxID=2304606 RepID=UPI004034D263
MASSVNIVNATTDSTPETTDVTNPTAAKDWGSQLITKVQLQNSEGKPQDTFDPYDDIRAYWEFATPNGGVNENDTITVTIPKQLVITGDITAPQPVTEIPGGKQIGTATLNKTNRTVTMTFNSYAANKSKTDPVTGSFYVNTSWNLNLVQEHQKVPIDWNVSGSVTSNTNSTGSASVGQAAVTDPNEILYKYGSYVENGDIIQWTVRVNYKGEKIPDAVYNDTLGKNQSLLNDTDHPITVNSATADHETGNITNDTDNKFANIKAIITKDGFTINLGDIDQTAIITYYTKIDNLDDKSSSYSNTGDLLSNKDELQNITINQPNTTLGSDAHDGDQVTSIMGHKIWNVPAGTDIPDSITINLIQNGNSATPLASKTVTADTNWSYVFNSLPKYDDDGNPYSYTVQETPVAGFTSIPDLTSYDITNVLSKLKVTKVWNDGNNKYNQRPKSVIVGVYGDGVPDPNYLSLSEKNNWSHTWENLPSNANWTVSEIGYNKTGYDYNDDGTVWYSAPNNYIATQTINNGNKFDKTITNTLTTKFKVTKIWEDTNHESSRPAEVKVELYANGDDTGKSATLNAGNDWSHTFGSKNDLPKFDTDKNEITYTAKETTILGDYKVTYDEPTANDTEQTITNTLQTAGNNTTHLQVSKIWSDDNNEDNIRPDHVTVNLIKDGTKVDSVKLNDVNNWKHDFTGLDKDAKYTVSEDSVNDYKTIIDDSIPTNVKITNTHTPTTTTTPTEDTTNLNVTKIWSDDNNKDNLRPDHVIVNLLKDGTKVDSVKLNDANSWKHNFTGLDKNAKYDVSEDSVDNYVSNIDNINSTNVQITNTHTPATTTTTDNKTNLTVKKSWNDQNNQDNLRPSQVTVHLLKNGKIIDQPVTLSSLNAWSYTWNNLDKNGKYTVQEDAVAGYTTTQSSSNGVITITNKHNVTKTPDNPGTPTIPGGNNDNHDNSFTNNNGGGDSNQNNPGNGDGSNTTTNFTPDNPMVPSPIYQQNNPKNGLLPQTGAKDTNIIYSIVGLLLLGLITAFGIKRKQA